jgi:hypothetical protein
VINVVDHICCLITGQCDSTEVTVGSGGLVTANNHNGEFIDELNIRLCCIVVHEANSDGNIWCICDSFWSKGWKKIIKEIDLSWNPYNLDIGLIVVSSTIFDLSPDASLVFIPWQGILFVITEMFCKPSRSVVITVLRL